MANGDAAAAAGMATVAGTADLRLGYDEINKTRDYLAAHQTIGTHPATAITSGVFPVARGGTGQATPLTAANIMNVGNTVATDLANISAALGSFRGLGNGNFGSTPILTPDGRGNPVGSWVSAGIGTDGRIAITASSRRVKKNIKMWSPDLQAVLAMQLVTFSYLEGYGDDQLQVGLIAEELHDLGLEWLVFYDDEGRPQGIHYERVALALLPVIQDHETRLAALEAR
jgi:hypothetical protein